jgi:DNA-binding NarL/FixJ family response regulator
MSSVGTEAVPQAVPSDLAVDVALIAGKATSASITAVLDRQGLAHKTHPDVKTLLRRAQRSGASVIVLSVDGAASGLAADVEALTRALPQTPVVVLCAELERWAVRAALGAGAAGIVLSGELEQTLEVCIRAVLAGQTCVPRDHWRQIDPPALSNREKQILGLVVMGYTNSAIAGQLFLAESTVKSHLSSAFGKLGVRSRNEAVNLILDPERGLGMGILALVAE